jgi:hypothetical protein
VAAGYVVSLVACALLALLLIVRRGERRAAGRGGAARPVAGRGEGAVALPAWRAALWAVPIALGLGFVFAARGTPLFWLGAFVVLWRGVDARRLSLAAGALLLVAVPGLTLLVHVDNRGGYNPEYASKRILVHWAAVAAISLLVLALGRALSTARARRDRGRSAPPSAAARPGSAP